MTGGNDNETTFETHMAKILTRRVESLTNAERLARAVLMFHDGSQWDDDKSATWKALTGSDEVTTKALGNLARAVRSAEELKEARRLAIVETLVHVMVSDGVACPDVTRDDVERVLQRAAEHGYMMVPWPAR